MARQVGDTGQASVLDAAQIKTYQNSWDDYAFPERPDCDCPELLVGVACEGIGFIEILPKIP